jgi:hypothetical protein
MPKALMPGLLKAQTGMARAGGQPSSGSMPNPMRASTGGNFAALENALLKGPKPNHKKMAPGSKSRPFKKAAAENFGQG